jgi:hypothetical protein
MLRPPGDPPLPKIDVLPLFPRGKEAAASPPKLEQEVARQAHAAFACSSPLRIVAFWKTAGHTRHTQWDNHGRRT